jgi:hypothetical protein
MDAYMECYNELNEAYAQDEPDPFRVCQLYCDLCEWARDCKDENPPHVSEEIEDYVTVNNPRYESDCEHHTLNKRLDEEEKRARKREREAKKEQERAVRINANPKINHGEVYIYERTPYGGRFRKWDLEMLFE